MKHTNKRRILSLLLALAMVISMLPVGVFAAEETATLVTDVTTLVLFGVVPFNILKGILVSVITMLLYKRVERIFFRAKQ